MDSSAPVILSFSGHDPTGGAGIQADIEAANALGCRVATVITAMTVQDTQTVHQLKAIDAVFVSKQAKAVLEDMPIAAFKLGLLGSHDNINAIHEILHTYRDIPVIVDPVLRSGDGSRLANEDMMLAYSDLIFPLTTLVTPNSHEALNLAHESDNSFSCAQELMDDGCEYVLITGSHEATRDVINTLYHDHKKVQDYQYQRLPNEYHGSGCTLASAITALIAQNKPILEAVPQALDYTWNTLKHAHQLGMCQWHPNRCFPPD